MSLVDINAMNEIVDKLAQINVNILIYYNIRSGFIAETHQPTQVGTVV